MKPLDPELSPDCEWMLQSEQVSQAALATVLVREFYGSLFDLAEYIFQDDCLAVQVTRNALASSLLEKHFYSGDERVLVWLLAHVVRESKKEIRRLALGGLATFLPHLSRRYSALENRRTATIARSAALRLRRIGLAPHLLVEYGLNAAEAARVLGIRPRPARQPAERHPGESVGQNALPRRPLDALEERAVVAEILRRSQRTSRLRSRMARLQEIALVGLAVLMVLFYARIFPSLAPAPPLTQEFFAPRMVTRLVQITATPVPRATATPYPERAVFYNAEEGDTLERIAERSGVNPAILAALNGIAPDQILQPGQHIMVGIGAPLISDRTPTPVTPVALPAPLDLNATSEEIIARILASRRNWNTLWADVLEIQHGPSGYVGPPSVYRHQVWLARPSYGLTISGSVTGEVGAVTLAAGGRVYQLDSRSGERNLYSTGDLIPEYTLTTMLMPNFYDYGPGSALEVVAAESVAGREALMVDWVQGENSSEQDSQAMLQGKLWVDTYTGTILRRQLFDRGDEPFLSEEMLVTAIVYEVDFPAELFDHYRPAPQRFAASYTGEPEAQPSRYRLPNWLVLAARAGLHPTPPPDFDPSGSRLAFQWRSLPSSYGASAQVEVIAGRYSLGQVEFGDPQATLCRRSPDGRRIAYTWYDSLRGGWYTSLSWLDLTALDKVHRPLPDVTPHDIMFAPDGKQLAVTGCTGRTECHLYVIDLDSSKVRQLFQITGGNLLAWRPDGAYLAFVGAQNYEEWQAMVISARDGKLVYKGPFDWNISRAPGSPLEQWGIDYPNWVGGLQGCVQPPAEP